MKKNNIQNITKKSEPIAIVGLACRFPGASNPEEFWKLLADGRDVVSEIPANRWNHDEYYNKENNTPEKTHQKHGAFLNKIHDFDPFFFNISPREAAEMNPAQKLALELAWETIENSTIAYKNLEGGNTGVFIGTCWYDFERVRMQRNTPVTHHTALGQSTNLIANRISYAFGFTGPSFVIDTGCSASLFAIHLACQNLQNYSIDTALAGGVNTLLDPSMYVTMTHFGALSPDGKCYSFDARGNGYVRGEGAGMIMLKRLSDAENDGDKIYGVIKGSIVNNNGFNQNLPATSIKGQVEALEKVYTEADVDPSSVHFVEAHGTGTRVGDPIEAAALGKVLGANRKEEKSLRLGSVKTNIGHLEGAAGIAGLIKVLLAIQKRKLPKNLNFEIPNPEIPFKELRIQVQQQLENWPAEENELLTAGVNSFGWGGTNAHVIVQEYKNSSLHSNEIQKALSIRSAHILPLSAKSEEALYDLAVAFISILENKINGNVAAFAALCASAAIRRPGLDYRTAFVSTTKKEMVEQLNAFIESKDELEPVESWTKERKTVFVFPGQGGQWVGMGKKLYQYEPVFKKTIDKCEKAFSEFTDWSLLTQLFAEKENSRLNEINVIQPAICAIQIALAALWKSWGVTPDAVVGHSMGEVAAAHVAGAISLQDAARIICTRSLLMKKMSGKGAMAVTELSAADAEKLAAQYPGKLSVAVQNSPKSSVLSGDTEAIKKIVTEIEKKGLFAREVKVDVASHSYQMDSVKDELRTALQSIKPTQESVAIYSTVYNAKVEGTALHAEYWGDNLRDTVQFASVVEQMLEDGAYAFIEMSPHPVLSTAIKDCKQAFNKEALILYSTHREEQETSSLLYNLSALFEAGYPVNWQAYFGNIPAPHYTLPNHPMYRETYEIESRVKESEQSKTEWKTDKKHAWLAPGIQLADDENLTYFNASIDTSLFPGIYYVNHANEKVLSKACILEAISAALEDKGISIFEIKNLSFSHYPIKQKLVELQLKLKQEGEDLQAAVYAIGENKKWIKIAEGSISLQENKPKSNISIASLFEATGLQSYQSSGTLFYHKLSQKGLKIATDNQVIEEIKFANNKLIAKVKSPSSWLQFQKYFSLHPILLDACLHALKAMAGTVDNISELESIQSFSTFHKPDFTTDCWLIADLNNSTGGSVQASLSLLQDNGLLLWNAGLTIASRQSYNKGTCKFQHTTTHKEAYQTPLQPTLERQKDRKPINYLAPGTLPAEHIEKVLKEEVAIITKSSPNKIKMNLSFKRLGVDSMMAVQLKNRLNEKLGAGIQVTSFWSVSSLKEFVNILEEKVATHSSHAVKEEEKTAAAITPTPAAPAIKPAIGSWSIEQLETLLKQEVADIIKSSPNKIKLTLSFKKLGIDSMMAVQLRNRLNNKLNASIQVTSFWAYPSLKEFLNFLQEQISSDKPVEVSNSATPVTCSAVKPNQQTHNILTEEERLSQLSLDELAAELDKELDMLLD